MLVWSWDQSTMPTAQLPWSALALAAAPVVTALILPAEWPHHCLPASLQLLPWLLAATASEWPHLHKTLTITCKVSRYTGAVPKHAKPWKISSPTLWENILFTVASGHADSFSFICWDFCFYPNTMEVNGILFERNDTLNSNSDVFFQKQSPAHPGQFTDLAVGSFDWNKIKLSQWKLSTVRSVDCPE